MTLPLVTCVLLTTVPRRNRFLPDALRSFRAQSYPAKELVIVNDGEPIRSAAPDIRVINLPDIRRRWTIGEKRNVGVREARGAFVATWDDDDISLPERLALQVEYALRCNAAVVLSDRMIVADEDMNLIGTCHRGKQRPVQASALLARDAIVAVGGYPAVSYREDVSMHERIRYYGRGCVAVMPDCDFYIMRRHGSNVTLDAGELNDDYVQCALNDPRGRRLGRAVEELRAIDVAHEIEGIET